jgi:ABC-type uncharacterized transport system permease subunit
MKRKTLITSLIMIVVGFITARVGDAMSTVVPAGDGAVIVQDSILMPIGALVSVLGFLALIVVALWYLVDFIRGKLKKE